MNYSTAEKIRTYYTGKENIDCRNSEDAINQTVSILSSGGLYSAWIYTGTAKGYSVIDGLLVIRPNIKARIYAVVYVDYMDEYNIDLLHIGGESAELIRNVTGVYVEELAVIYERVYDEYIESVQAGFYTI